MGPTLGRVAAVGGSSQDAGADMARPVPDMYAARVAVEQLPASQSWPPALSGEVPGVAVVTVYLACGHVATGALPARVGQWLSCWAVMYPKPGCQTQRKVIRVTGYWQGALW